MAATRKQWESALEFDAGERGSSLIAILSVVVTLGILVAITLSFTLGTTTPTTLAPQHPNTGTTSTTTTAPKDAASGASEATLAACEANFAIIESAVEDYRALNGVAPPAGTAWATSDANGGPLMQSWPSAPSSYAITWNGRELSVIPVRGVASHGSMGSGTPKTGCFAAA
ncbi:MAG TPA: hypothetical protein VGP11_05155 [Acidimicrobiales bacterium]|jgi:hypothetical protein|nr:hypothetical protein [Acidimicrobiales bacterium]